VRSRMHPQCTTSNLRVGTEFWDDDPKSIERKREKLRDDLNVH